jgi:predicted amidohydrolase
VAAKKAAPKKVSMTDLVAPLVMKNPTWDLAKVKSKLTATGVTYKDITVATVFYDVRRILKAVGVLK